MKKMIFTTLLLLACSVFAVPVHRKPVVRIQPNGDTIHLFVTGDEYYHRLHDADNYTVVLHPETGYWVYAQRQMLSEDRWDVVATDYVVGKVNPGATSLEPNVGIDRESWLKCQHKYDIQERMPSPKTSGRNHGTLNNIVIFIRFADDDPITKPFSDIEAMFNDSSETAVSMNNYFKSVSYNKLNVVTHFYPTPSGDNVISYQDSLPRCRFMPYSSRNPEGYHNNEYDDVELSLLERAINYINDSCPIPESINIDMDDDGFVDNLCFVIKGEAGDWNDLLWPHMWSLISRFVYINGKQVKNFNFQLEGADAHYFGPSTFSHEMFHTLGSPDLYHYDNYIFVTPVGDWDIMSNNNDPPQNMGAYMKWKYGNWLDSIPEIREPGTYTLHSVGSNSSDNCCYKVATPHQNQWYILEYRNYNDFFDQTIPGSGLIVYRIDDRFDGNQDFDGRNRYDEVYVFRPGGTNHRNNGYPAQAFFSATAGRTAFDRTTDPRPWLSGNVEDTSIFISNVSEPGETISFTVAFSSVPPVEEEDTVSVSIVDVEPMVTVSHSTITIADPARRATALYDITGSMLGIASGSDRITFTAPSAGVYILMVEGLPAKKVAVMKR